MIMEQHLGVVMANDTDTEKRGGIQVRVDTLLADFEYPDLFFPVFPPNMLKVPEVGEVVEVIVIGDFDENDPSEDGDLGTVEFSDYCFYTGKVFDVNEGTVPQDLQTNYPKRAGLFWHKDGTIIYYDSTKNAKEMTIALTDKKTLIRLKENEVFIQQDQNSWQMKGGKIITVVDDTEMGAAGASHPITKGDILKTFLEAVQSGFGSTHTHTYNNPVHIAGVVSTGPPSPTMDTVPTDLNSTKHKVDA